MTQNSTASYKQIIRSTSIIGGAAGIGLLMGMVRLKFAALLIGPVGVGLVGTYQAIQMMFGTIAGLGIQQSAVRDIAAAIGRGDDVAMGRAVLVLRRGCRVTGLAGAMLIAALALPVSLYTFSSDNYAPDIALLAPIVLFAIIQGGQLALLQGMRRIGDIARINVIGSVAGTVVSVALYVLLGMRGIIPSLTLIALIQLIATWNISRKLDIPQVAMSWKESFCEAGGMVSLGVAFMWSGLAVTLVAYLTRAWIAQEFDLLAVGIFTAAFSLSGMFINFILGAMGADYYPRLTEFSRDHAAMRRLVNQQAEIGLILAVPGLLATLTLAPWIVRAFFTAEFLPAVEPLRWFILGCLGRIISWPLSFVMLALDKSRWFFLTETTFNVLHLCMVWIGLTLWGVEGVAIAFFCVYIVYVAAIYRIAHRLIRFAWSPFMLQLFAIFLPLLLAAFLSGRYLSLFSATIVGIVLTTVTSVLCFLTLRSRLKTNS